jgi:peroxiredoxin (alkyl hydroperoxide reductase subunit C)
MKDDTDFTNYCEPLAKIGTSIDFVGDMDLEVYHRGKRGQARLRDYAGKWLILFFYPADFTFVCPTELEELAGLYPQLKEMNTEVLSISTDTVNSHKVWHDTSEAIGKIKFPMLSDHKKELCEYFGVLDEESGLARRGTFIIDPDGILLTSEIHIDGIGRSGVELLRKLQAAQFVRKHGNLVCPASWQPGAKTLEPGDELVGKI